VRGRELTFADPEILDLAAREFVAVVADEPLERRRKGPMGDFFRQATAGAPFKGPGLYCLSGAGRLLGATRSHKATTVGRLLRSALDAFRAAPKEPTDGLGPEPRDESAPPDGALILRVHARTLEPDGSGDTAIHLALAGEVLLATAPDSAAADRGYEASIEGTVEIDRSAGRITRFELTAIGELWGEWQWSPGARPGRSPLGFHFELVTGRGAADLVPPHAARGGLAAYFGS
jgi:hypothetical protein